MPDTPAVSPPGAPAPLDLHVVAATLRSGSATDAWVRSWLPATCAAPERFVEALYGHVMAHRRGMKSRLGRAYDLYHDCVVANLEVRTPALFARPRDGAPYEEISYGTLHDRCTLLAAAWKRLGVERGQSVCVALPVGVEYAVSILTGLRMGLVITTLEPHGPTFVRSRLEVLSPDWTATNERLRGTLRLPPAHLLPVVGVSDTGAPPMSSHTPDDVVFSLFSPFGEGDAPVEVTAGALHASLLRDGLVVLGLETSDVLAAPAFDPMQAAPHLLLVALAAGACYAEISPADLESDPRLAARARLSVLGVGRDLRERMLARGADWLGATGRVWFKNLTDVLEVDRWEALARLLSSKKLPGLNLFVNAATGGIELFSPRAAAPSCLRAWPVPGRSFQLSEVAAGAVPALNDTGVYTVMDGKAPAELPLPRFLLARQGDGYFFAGALDVGQDAQTYPRAEVARVAAQLPAVRHATVVLGPGRWMNDARTVLIVFTDDARGPDGLLALPVTIPEIRARVAREMGARFVPERIIIYPLRPRLVNGAVDDGWCRSQYLSGTLDAKARSEMFILLSRLGYILAGGASGE